MKKSLKSSVIKKHQKHGKDTGSHTLQVAMLTERINGLQGHLEKHKNDKNSRRGLLMMVGHRRKLLTYLSSADKAEYDTLLEKLNLRK